MIGKDDDVKVTALVLAALVLLGEPAHVEHNATGEINWSHPRIIADSDGASTELTVRSPFKAKGLWIIEVGSYVDGLSLRKRDFNAIKADDLARLIQDSLTAARKQRKRNMAASTWQVVADRINASTPRCALAVTASPNGLRLHIPSTLHVTEEHARTMMTLADSLGLRV